jgi:hypothetical protein
LAFQGIFGKPGFGPGTRPGAPAGCGPISALVNLETAKFAFSARFVRRFDAGIQTMTMDRQQLARAIDVGRSSALNCFQMTKDIRVQAKAIDAEDPLRKLFRITALNDSIFFKVIETSQQSGHLVYSVETLLYFPFNHANIYEGGDSVLFSDPKFLPKLYDKTGVDTGTDEGREKIDNDRPILEMIESLPTLDPFLLKSKAQQLGIEDRIHPNYFNISLEDWRRIQAPIRKKISALVLRALGGDADEDDPVIEQHVSKFLSKIWEARDVDGIEDFVRSLDIPVEKAPELFFAWKAICFYQVQFQTISPHLKNLYAWIGNDNTALPVDLKVLPYDDRQEIKYKLRIVRNRLRENHDDIRNILSTYEKSYSAFIKQGEPKMFKEFLGRADEHYIELAASISSNTHAINLLYDQTKRWGKQLKSPQYHELIDCFMSIYNLSAAPGKGGSKARVAAA